MDINISQYIIQQLKELGRVSLPKVGSFTLEQLDALIHQNRTSISAPSYKITYSTAENDIENLIQAISSDKKISSVKAAEIISGYGEDIKGDLDNQGKAIVHSIGELIKTQDNIEFIQSENSIFSKLNYYLPDVLLTPIKRDAVEKKAMLQNILGAEVKTVRNDKPATINEMLAAKSKTKTPVIATTTSQDESEPQYTKYEEEKPGFFSWHNLKDWLIALLVTLLIICCYRSCVNNNKTNVINGIVQSEQAAITSPLDSNNGTVEANIVDANTNTSLDSNETVPNEVPNEGSDENLITGQSMNIVNCVIITGSFKRIRNAGEMEGKIRSLGYEPFVQENGDFTRVGLKFNCKDVDLPSYIQEIRQQIEIESWYLEPDLEVPRK